MRNVGSNSVDTELEHIEVTARKTLENLQRVPVSITSVGANKIDESGISALNEIQMFSPNTTLQTATATNSTLMAFIRGVGQEDQVWGYESGVGIYIDDVYISRPQGAVLEILDVERIEVLRGPQGTLYGKNTSGGAVKYITKKMHGDPELNIKSTLGSYSQKDVKIAGQLPLIDNELYVSVAAASINRDGFGQFLNSDIDNQDKENYNKDLFAVRFSMEYTPTDKLFMRLNYDKTQDSSNARGGHRFLPSIIENGPEPIPDNVYNASTSLPTWNTLELEGISLTADYAFNTAWSVKSITAKRKGYSQANIDFDNTSLRIFDVPAIYDDKQFTQEFQLNYQNTDLTLVSGLYYYDGEACGVFNAILDELGSLLGYPGFSLESSGCSNSESIAAYSLINYSLSDEFSITLGGRFTQEKKKAYVYYGAIYETLYPSSGWVPGYIRNDQIVDSSLDKELDDAKTWSRFTPKLGFEYQQNDNVMWFTSYAQGFKSGMFNPRAQTAEPAVDPEIVNSFEIGLKSEWFNKLRINATVFNLDHKDRQFVTVLEGNGPGDLDQRLGNIGKSEAKGAELELSYAATSSFDIQIALGYINSDFTEARAYNGVDYDDISHRFSIIQTPDKTANLNLNYNIDSTFGHFVLNANYYYRSTYDLVVLDNLKSQSGFGLTNLSLNWYDDNDHWYAGLHIKNLTDERYLTGSFAFVTKDPDTGEILPGAAADNIFNGYYGDPRTVSLTLGYRF